MFDKENMIKNLPRPMQKFEPKVQMKTEGEIAHLYLYGDVIEDGYVWDKDEEYISSKKVRAELEKLDGQNLVIHLNSFGGMAFEGVAIYNTLMDYKGQVDIQIDGVAASAASIIAMAGKTITGRSNTMLMIHKSRTVAYGNADEFLKMADDMNKIDMSLRATYLQRFKNDVTELDELLKSETWMTADECLKYGFYDSIIEDDPEDEPVEEPEDESVEDEPVENEKPKNEVKTLFDLWNEKKEQENKQNLFAKFKEAK